MEKKVRLCDFIAYFALKTKTQNKLYNHGAFK